MKRKILTFKNGAGVTEDLLPYVDGYSVEIGGTNLVDYLDQIESTFAKALLFLGAFASESALLTAYPNGSELEVGTYAIVSDTDTLYIYDTDNEEWLATASNISGIMELNGLTPVSGALTITGGDINATVSNAETQTQTITSHLNALYGENDDENDDIQELFETPIDLLKNITTSIDTVGDYTYVTYAGQLETKRYAQSPQYHTGSYVLVHFRTNTSATGDENVRISVNSGAKVYVLYKNKSYNSPSFVKYKELYARLGFQGNSGNVEYGQPCLVYLDNVNNRAYLVDFKHEPLQKHKVVTLASNSWRDHPSAGYYYPISYKSGYDLVPNCYVLSVSKLVDGKYTTAIVDYSLDTTYNILNLYSDEKFDGNVVLLLSFE